MKLIKKIILSILILSFITINLSFAQTSDSISGFAPIQMEIPCIEAQYDLRIGSRDYALFGDVMKLQLFLYQNELMHHPPTGYFGSITQSSLIKYQSLRGLQITGFFDFNTRNTLAKETCGDISNLLPSSNYEQSGQNTASNNIDLNNLFNNSGSEVLNNQGTQNSTFNVSGGMFSE